MSRDLIYMSPSFNPSNGGGYATAAVSMVRAALKAGVKTRILPTMGAAGIPADLRHLLDTPVAPDAFVLGHGLPFQTDGWPLKLDGLYTTYETEKLPKWIEDKILASKVKLAVPSTFNAYGVNGTTVKATVIPHPALPEWTVPYDTTRQTDGADVFLYVGNWNARKNPEAIIRAWIAAFPEDHAAKRQLWLKLPGIAGLSDLVDAVIQSASRQFATGLPRQDIKVVCDSWTDEQMLWAYRQAKVFVSLHCSEGFGLGPFQACCMGKLVVATWYSGTLEFLGVYDGSIPVRANRCAVPGGQEHFAMQSGDSVPLTWAEPDPYCAVEAIQRAAMRLDKGFLPKDGPGMADLYSLERIGGMLKTWINKPA